MDLNMVVVIAMGTAAWAVYATMVMVSTCAALFTLAVIVAVTFGAVRSVKNNQLVTIILHLLSTHFISIFFFFFSELGRKIETRFPVDAVVAERLKDDLKCLFSIITQGIDKKK